MIGVARFLALVAAVATAAIGGGVRAELAAPQLGDVHKWVCQGDHAESYVTKVVAIDNGIVRFEEQIDGEIGYMEKPAAVQGLSLFLQRQPPGEAPALIQEFDPADFAPYAQLQPGTTINAEVRESDGDDTKVYSYSVEIGEPEVIEHEVIGQVTVVPVVEERWVYRQQYSSTYKFTIVPERALVVNWSFSDPAGKSDCDLYLTFKKKIKATN